MVVAIPSKGATALSDANLASPFAALYAPAHAAANFFVTALHSEPYRRFVELLADARRYAGLSQYDLAERLGVDQSFVSKYEAARRRLDVIEFLRIASAIGADPHALLQRLGDAGGPKLSGGLS